MSVYRGAELLSENGLAVDGCHAEKGADPHPEDGARPAGSQSGCAAGDIAGAHLRGDGGGKGLKGAHAFVIRFFPVQIKPAEQAAHSLAEFANLD